MTHDNSLGTGSPWKDIAMMLGFYANVRYEGNWTHSLRAMKRNTELYMQFLGAGLQDPGQEL